MTWEWQILGSLTVEVQTGFASGKHSGDGDVLHLRPMNISPRGTLNLDGGKFVAANAGAQRVAHGDVLFNNTNSPKWVGKTAYVDSDRELAFSNHMTRLRTSDDRLDPKFLATYLHYQQSLGYFEEICSNHVNQASVSRKALLQTVVPLPPLAEQHRIVEVLEAHLSRLDAAEASLQLSASRLRALTATAINYSLSAAPASGRCAPPPPAADVIDGDLPLLPDSWHWQRLGTLAEVVGGITKDSKKQNNPELPLHPYLRVANVQAGYLDLDHITEIRASSAQVDKLTLQRGDVLLNEGGDRDKLGRGWVWEDQIPNCLHQNHVFRARVVDGQIDPRLIAWHANSFGRRWFIRNGKQSVNLASVNLSTIRSFPIPVPPINEQPAIVARISEGLEQFERGTAAVGAALARSTNLRRLLLRAAFAGNLVGQDPVDEPSAKSLAGSRSQ